MLASVKIHIRSHEGWTYVRTILSQPQFLGGIDNQILLHMVIGCERFARERALLLLFQNLKKN